MAVQAIMHHPSGWALRSKNAVTVPEKHIIRLSIAGSAPLGALAFRISANDQVTQARHFNACTSVARA